MALVHDDSCKKKHVTHDYRHMCPVLLCRCLRAVCLRSVCPAMDSLVTRRKEFFLGGFWGGGESDGLKKVLTQGDFCAVL